MFVVSFFRFPYLKLLLDCDDWNWRTFSFLWLGCRSQANVITVLKTNTSSIPAMGKKPWRTTCFFHVRFLRWQTSCVSCPNREQGGHKIRQVVDQRLEFQVVYIVLFAFEATTNRLGATSAGGDWLGWSVSGRFGWFCGCLQHEKTQNSAGGKFNTSQDFRVLLWYAMVWCILAASYVHLVSLGWLTVKACCSCIEVWWYSLEKNPKLPGADGFDPTGSRWERWTYLWEGPRGGQQVADKTRGRFVFFLPQTFGDLTWFVTCGIWKSLRLPAASDLGFQFWGLGQRQRCAKLVQTAASSAMISGPVSGCCS